MIVFRDCTEEVNLALLIHKAKHEGLVIIDAQRRTHKSHLAQTIAQLMNWTWVVDSRQTKDYWLGQRNTHRLRIVSFDEIIHSPRVMHGVDGAIYDDTDDPRILHDTRRGVWITDRFWSNLEAFDQDLQSMEWSNLPYGHVIATKQKPGEPAEAITIGDNLASLLETIMGALHDDHEWRAALSDPSARAVHAQARTGTLGLLQRGSGEVYYPGAGLC